jgi:hypothetical protein
MGCGGHIFSTGGYYGNKGRGVLVIFGDASRWQNFCLWVCPLGFLRDKFSALISAFQLSAFSPERRMDVRENGSRTAHALVGHLPCVAFNDNDISTHVEGFLCLFLTIAMYLPYDTIVAPHKVRSHRDPPKPGLLPSPTRFSTRIRGASKTKAKLFPRLN